MTVYLVYAWAAFVVPVRCEAVAALSVRCYLLDKLVGLWCWLRFR